MLTESPYSVVVMSEPVIIMVIDSSLRFPFTTMHRPTGCAMFMSQGHSYTANSLLKWQTMNAVFINEQKIDANFNEMS